MASYFAHAYKNAFHAVVFFAGTVVATTAIAFQPCTTEPTFQTFSPQPSGFKIASMHTLSSSATVIQCQCSSKQHHDIEQQVMFLQKQGYQRMDLPLRAESQSHVIYGTLLTDNVVESYRSFKNMKWNNKSSENVVVALVQLGNGVDGHPGVVHGGILALIVDDVLGFGYEALDDVPMAVTANLNVNYLKAVPAGSRLWIQAQLQKQEGRKLHWSVQVMSADNTETVYCEATSLFIIPRHLYHETDTEKVHLYRSTKMANQRLLKLELSGRL